MRSFDAMAENAVVAVSDLSQGESAEPKWVVTALDINTGESIWQQKLDGNPLPNALLIDRDGQVIVVMEDGGIACFGEKKGLFRLFANNE